MGMSCLAGHGAIKMQTADLNLIYTLADGNGLCFEGTPQHSNSRI